MNSILNFSFGNWKAGLKGTAEKCKKDVRAYDLDGQLFKPTYSFKPEGFQYMKIYLKENELSFIS